MFSFVVSTVTTEDIALLGTKIIGKHSDHHMEISYITVIATWLFIQ